MSRAQQLGAEQRMFSKFLKSKRDGKSAAEMLLAKEPSPANAMGPQQPQNFAANGAYSSDDIVRQFQQDRNSYVIGIIHRHESENETWEQWFWDAMIGGHHLQDFMTALENVPSDARLDIVLHSLGGFNLCVELIARAVKAHKGETTVFVPHHAHYNATLIALAADKIVMGPGASLSFLEPSASVLEEVVKQKGVRKVQDETLLRLSVSRNFARELGTMVSELSTRAGSNPSRIVKELTGGRYSPWDPMTPALASKVGLSVSTDMPAELYRLIQACRAAPVKDKGIKTVDRSVSPQRVSKMSAIDIETCLMHGVQIPKPDGSHMIRRATEATPEVDRSVDDDEGDDLHGVALENCDIAIRPFIAKMEQLRNSRVLCVIHQPGMESSSVDTVTAEDLLTALQATPADKPLDIILHTPGGYSYQAHQIALAIKAHRGRKTVFVPYFAMSGGTIIALAADEIVMAPTASLGPIDSQFSLHHMHGSVPARAVLDLLQTKPKQKIGDELLELGSYCKRTIVQDHKNALELMRGTYSTATADRIAHTLNDGTLTHSYPVLFPFAKKLGLNVNDRLPPEATAIVRAFRKNRYGKRSVIYCS